MILKHLAQAQNNRDDTGTQQVIERMGGCPTNDRDNGIAPQITMGYPTEDRDNGVPHK